MRILGLPDRAPISVAKPSELYYKELVTMSVLQSVHRHAIVLFAALSLAAGAVRASPTLSATEALEKAKTGEITLIDIRTPKEWRQTGVAA
jgi:hypothetical protein